ncbi:LmbE family N-acetylglucosaminyl deacetylase [Catenulispora sp. MAP12-49]
MDRPFSPSTPEIVAISPHADDAEYGAGCLLAAHAALGCRVTIVLMTGANETRVIEAKAAAAALGADLILDPSGSDGCLEITSDRISWLETQLAAASLVLAPHPDDTHQDHRATAGITATALRRSATALSWYRTPSSGPGFSPTAFFPILDEAAAVRGRAIDQHQTQAGRAYLRPEHLALKDSWFGWLGGHRAAEPFQVVRHQFGQLPRLANTDK